MRYCVINGYPQSGKDAFVDFCKQEKGALCKKVSTVDFIKDIAYKYGWTGEKTPKDRKFLSDLKNLFTEWNDIPFKETMERIREFHQTLQIYEVSSEGIVFIMSREPAEIMRFKHELGAISVLIERDAVKDNEQSNEADSGVMNCEYDVVVYNNGTLEDLQTQAKLFLQNIKIFDIMKEKGEKNDSKHRFS